MHRNGCVRFRSQRQLVGNYFHCFDEIEGESIGLGFIYIYIYNYLNIIDIFIDILLLVFKFVY